MIALNQLLFSAGTVSKRIDEERYRYETDPSVLRYTKRDLAVLFWNLTLRCNLRCIHCYANAKSEKSPNELTENEIFGTIDDLRRMGLPVVILSGGEPMLHENIYEISRYADESGIRVTLSSNGTLIDEKSAFRLAESGVKYVGISLDGYGEKNDTFRGVRGAFERAVEGLRNVKDAGMMSGIRFTVTKYNVSDLPKVFELGMELGIDRFCLYHLVPAGRSSREQDIDNVTRRWVIDYLIEKTYDLHDKSIEMEILTVDNPADGVYLLLKLLREGDKRAGDIYRLLKRRGGDNSGIKAGNIDPWGNVHPNQFWWDYTMGNVRNEKFDKIWAREDGIIRMLRREKKELLKGKCARCKFKDICGGFRLRALRYNGDLWGEDPDCYLDEDEISVDVNDHGLY
ncbi:MAG: radical SAM protein [Thermoplasmata archaeon]